MALNPAVQGDLHQGQKPQWERTDGSYKDLTGATISGTITNVETGVTRVIAGALAVVDAVNGIFTWTYAVADTATPGVYDVQFTASYGGVPDSTYVERWIVTSKN